MIKNYLKIAWRNILNNKIYSGLNIIGLSIGMAVALIIGLWVQFQYSFDRFLPNHNDIYQTHIRYVENGQPGQQISTPFAVSEQLRKEIPEIKYTAHTDWMGNHDLLVGEKKFVLS